VLQRLTVARGGLDRTGPAKGKDTATLGPYLVTPDELESSD
jgi:hypothetical protein